MAVAKYTKTDIQKASETLTGRITEADIATLVAGVYAANRGGTDILAAFNAAFHGGTPPVEWGTDFVKAAKAAKKERLADNRAKRSGETPKNPLEEVLVEADKRFTALDNLVTATSKSASDAEADASMADTVVGKIKKYRPLLPAEVTAQDNARSAATAARTTADAADEQLEGGSSALEAVEGVILVKGPLAEAQVASDEIEAARIAAGPHKRTTARQAAIALRNRQALDRALAALVGGGPPPEEEPSWFKKHRVAVIAIGIAIVALAVGWHFGLPERAPEIGIIVIAIVATFAALAPHESGRRAAIGIAVIMMVVAGAAIIIGGGGNSSGDGGNTTNLRFPTVDGSRYSSWSPGGNGGSDGLSPIVVIGAVIITAFITVKVRQWLNARHTP